MSQPQYGWNMDRPSGSVKRARERAQAGHPPRRPPPPMMMDDASPQGHLSPPPRRHMPPSQPPPPLPSHAIPPSSRPRGPAGFDGKGSHVISRPTQAPHWPLPPGSPLTPGNNNHSNRPPPGRPQQAPPRPARPSRIPSLVDQSRPQEPTPVFFNPQDHSDERRESEQDYHSSTPATPSSRLTTSSVGTIPEFPTPGSTPAPPMPIPPRKSATTLGPPPTSRRGASSFYSNASYVSPIPEESSRSHGSYASSAAMPETWSPASPPMSPNYGDAFYDDSVTEKSRESNGDDYGDESKLVRSASIGKKGKAALVDNKPSAAAAAAATQTRPTATPVQPFEGGTGYMDESNSSSEKVSTKKKMPEPTSAPMDETFLMPIAMQVTPGSPGREPRLSPQPSKSSSRLSALRRPPKLDIDAVREAEARGSITSLPDLIKRATRLAAMIERGKRPASRFDNFNDLLEKANQDGTADDSSNDRHQSGLSDMLAAFPPPAQPTPNGRQSRGSWFRKTSWPLAPGQEQYDPNGSTPAHDEKPKAQRKCCGMRPWVFVLVIIVVLLAVAAAIVIPLQFFVFKTLGNHPEPQSSFDSCAEELDCQNGGTNVVSQGVCSCICTNGFTGPDCSIEGTDGCTTTNLVSSDSSSNINNVTLGRAIPRLIADANGNFSIPLSGTAILAKVNNGDISCRAQNSLVTFDGRPTRMGEAKAEIVDDNDALDEAADVNLAPFIPIKTLTVTPGVDATVTIPNENQGVGMPTQSGSGPEETGDTITATSLKPRSTDGAEPTSEPDSDPDDNFTITEEVLDFARVAVLYVLQEESSNDAEEAQSRLQRFFGAASETREGFQKATEKDARNVTLSGDNSVNLVDFRINIGDGSIGGKSDKRSLLARWLDEFSGLDDIRRGGSVLSRRSGI